MRWPSTSRGSLGVDWHDTTADGAVTLEPVFCLGLCAIGPSAMLDGAPLGRLDRHADRRGAGAGCVTARVYVPRDAAALALGADAVAALLAQAGDVQVVRTGSRGLFWLEPMVEVETAEGRIAYGPVTLPTSPACLAAGLLTGRRASAAARAAGGNPVLARADPPDLRPLRHRRSAVAGRLPRPWRHGAAWQRAHEIGPAATIETGDASGLRGRGGAGFPTGIKWKTAADAHRASANSSSATPMKATPAPMPTAC